MERVQRVQRVMDSEIPEILMTRNLGKHPSGLTMQEWLWPFKTAEQRKIVAKYYKKVDKQQRKKQLDDIELAPF